MHNLNVPKTNVILTLLKICCCNKRNVTMTKIKCNCKVVYTRNPDVPQKALSERSHPKGKVSLKKFSIYK